MSDDSRSSTPNPSTGDLAQDQRYRDALSSLHRTLDKLQRCSDVERSRLHAELTQLQDMVSKLTAGRVEIVVFGEISTGKSAMINALVGEVVASVDVQGGWTKEVWQLPWNGCGYCVPGLAGSQVVLVDTPGLNEVGGQERTEIARQAADRADLILFVTDSDLNDTEFSALITVAAAHKPLVLILNKIDLYTDDQRKRLIEVLQERVAGLLPADQIVTAAADPREREYIIESADGSTRTEWRKPKPDIQSVKAAILDVLEQDGMALITLNAAMYAADKSDRIATLRVQLRNRQAQQTIWSYAVLKSAAVALNPAPVLDVLGGSAVDATMVATLSHIYGLQMSWMHARRLVVSILKAAGWIMAGELLTSVASSAFKAVTIGHGTVLTAIPQGAAAGYGSYIVGQAAKYYFEHGSSWGREAPKTIVQRILNETDKQSVLDRLKDEIRARLALNPHAR